MEDKKFNATRYFGLTILQEAKKKQKDGFGFRAFRSVFLWKSNKCAWQHFVIRYGIRWSDKLQIFPIWNVSNNCNRALMIGVWKFYFEISYARKGNFNQKQKMIFGRKIHQLLF